jgi:hypothetical protein
MSVLIAVVCGIDTYQNYEGWQKSQKNYVKAQEIYDVNMGNCEKEITEIKKKICKSFYDFIPHPSTYFLKEIEFKEDLNKSIKRWLAFQMGLLVMYFGMRWVWTGKVKSKTD